MRKWIRRNQDALVVGVVLFLIQAPFDLYLQFQEKKDAPPVDVPPRIIYQPAVPTTTVAGDTPSSHVWASQSSDDFDVFVLSQEYRWQRGKTTVLDPDGLVTSLERELDTLVRQTGGEYADLIAVGTASCEGGPDEELKRAQERADQIVIWTRKALVRAGEPSRRTLHTLNLGKYARDCSDSPVIRADPRLTDEQRRIILIACKTKVHTKELVKALHRRMNEERPFGIHPDDYTTFVLDRWLSPP
ncbi:MAG TPA: hypothetical protein VKM72_29045 [Thermoanaerobaculia bacterium]|nr:hypothetical protein [Thermoanaerobaculia bacterium]